MRPRTFSIHPGVERGASLIRLLPGKTGRSLAEWVAVIRRDGPPGFDAFVERWLKHAYERDA